MDDLQNLAPNDSNLSEEESQKLTQFSDLTGIDRVKCVQILRANDWNLEVALDLALDGAYSEDHSTYHQPTTSNNHVRHRHMGNSTTSVEEGNVSSTSTTSTDEANVHNDTESHGLHVTLWNTTTWLFKLPFIIVINTLNTFYDFLATLIRPALNYDATGTVERFITEFETQYGTDHPVFFSDTYTRLLDQGKRDIRFVVIYLHSPSHRDTDRFCTNVIATRRFAEFVASENIIFWACSVYYPEGYKVFQSLKANAYPFVALVGLKNNKMVAMKKLEGYLNLEPFLAGLKSAMTNNEYSLIAARMDRQERNITTLIRAQQDAAFEESLRADQEKERKRREEEEKKANEERLKKEQEDKKNQWQERITNMKSSLNADIPVEPDLNDADSIRIMFKLPNGKRLERRFLKSDPVKYLYFFVFCNEKTLYNFKIRTNFPTRDLPGFSPSPDCDLNHSDMNIAIEKCDLGNNIMLFVHDLDS